MVGAPVAAWCIRQPFELTCPPPPFPGCCVGSVRCNLDASQRSDFVALAAAAGAPAHCLFINLPAPLCVKVSEIEDGEGWGA
jgi:hypothetical protein